MPYQSAAKDRINSAGKTILEHVAAAVSGLRHGAINLIVHDGRVVQLEVTERQRFT